MYEISNRDRDDAIEMLKAFATPENSSMSSTALINLRRRALLLSKKLNRKQPKK